MRKRYILLCFTIIFTLMAVNVSAATTITSNATGTFDGFYYELWKEYGGTANMTLNGGGTFSCSWESNINNALFRIGKKYNSPQSWHTIGDIIIEYACDYQPNGNSTLAVYGWNTDPRIEYYIVDSWDTWKVPESATPKGTITVDDGVYDIYVNKKYTPMSVDGTTDYLQYYNVRREKRTSGTVHVSDHFRAWENMGMIFGNLLDVTLSVEGYQSSGKAEVTKLEYNVVEPIEDTEAPTAPTELRSPYKTKSTISLAWTGSKDNVAINGYNIYNGSELVGTTKYTNYIFTGLKDNTTYTFTVKAVDVFGNLSAASNELTVTTDVAFRLGDINKDGSIDALDLATYKSYFLGNIPTLSDPAAADINSDGSIDALDYAAVKQYLLGLKNTLP